MLYPHCQLFMKPEQPSTSDFAGIDDCTCCLRCAQPGHDLSRLRRGGIRFDLATPHDVGSSLASSEPVTLSASAPRLRTIYQ
jgi:hypothetical protein